MTVTLPEVVREMRSLPPERVAEVYDFVLFLKTRMATVDDQSDEWSDEDCRDAATASQQYVEALLAAEDVDDD